MEGGQEGEGKLYVLVGVKGIPDSKLQGQS